MPTLTPSASAVSRTGPVARKATLDSILSDRNLDPAARLHAIASLPEQERRGVLLDATAADAVRQYVTRDAGSAHADRVELARMYTNPAMMPLRLRYLLAFGDSYFPNKPEQAGIETTQGKIARARRALLLQWSADVSNAATGLDSEEVLEILSEADRMAARRATSDGYKAVRKELEQTAEVRKQVAGGRDFFDVASAEMLGIHRTADTRPGSREQEEKLNHLRRVRRDAEIATRKDLARTEDASLQWMTSQSFPHLSARRAAYKEAVAREELSGHTLFEAITNVLNQPDGEIDTLSRLDRVDDDLRRYQQAVSPEYGARGPFEQRVAQLVADVEAGRIEPRTGLTALAVELRQSGPFHEGHAHRLRVAESAIRQAAWNGAKQQPEDSRLITAAQQVPEDVSFRIIREMNRGITPQVSARTTPTVPANSQVAGRPGAPLPRKARAALFR